jgi:two-component system chemotaxis response regulator CheY
MKILIVDDEVLNCKLLQSMLKDYGECSIAMTGDSAIEMFKDSLEKQEHFDLICLDIMMPEKDGHETLRAMRIMEQKQEVPPNKRSRIIMVTALGEQEDKTKAFYESCDGYLTKPIEQGLLVEILSKMGLISKPNN